MYIKHVLIAISLFLRLLRRGDGGGWEGGSCTLTLYNLQTPTIHCMANPYESTPSNCSELSRTLIADSEGGESSMLCTLFDEGLNQLIEEFTPKFIYVHAIMCMHTIMGSTDVHN